MPRDQKRIVLGNRDKQLFERLFENRVMSGEQIAAQLFSKVKRQNVSRRLMKLANYVFIERKVVSSLGGDDLPVFSATPKALSTVREQYPFKIVKELKSDSVEHDVHLVALRDRIQALGSVAHYYTENMLQSCEELLLSEKMSPFVKNNTDAVLGVRKNGKITAVGLEFEKSEKAFERNTKKIFSYYSDFSTPVIFYVCLNASIQRAVARAEKSVMGSNRPRCFYALFEDVLRPCRSCTFTNINGETITLD